MHANAATQTQSGPTRNTLRPLLRQYKLEHLAAFLRGRLDEPTPAIEGAACEE